MKHLKNVVGAFLVALFLSIGVGTTVAPVQVHATDLNQTVNSIKSSGGGVLGSDTKNKVTGLSKDATDIVGIIVMAVVTISGLWCAVKFAGAGDNPSAKSVLKGAIIMHVLGLVFLASYFGFVSFSFKNLNLFK
ncbi:hypothetical protein [Clostridium magnum]|uniref:TrbC/VIRB2 family protein n=1 Tax=Clostridium magnum DSM 2767 TaxID=1121326 RepID=A0A162TJ82_9CLOT|nr:hypothetical protein [Clostridium magnum]KZL92714.1 hypothetical protein CLMAG_25280 [Clostridium magnum DSM 2767]SHI24705.1 hypothetical protein SAMN02745944_03584 [Clostridium magnum DSM 2767]